jgi:hypothetical protein
MNKRFALWPVNSGAFNIPNFPNWYTFAALKADGSIAVRGSSNRGGEGAPSGNDYTKIYSNWTAFVALKADGSITLQNLNHPTP